MTLSDHLQGMFFCQVIFMIRLSRLTARRQGIKDEHRIAKL